MREVVEGLKALGERAFNVDVGTAVHVHESGAAYEVEFVTFGGHTVAVATVLPGQLRRAGRQDLVHVHEVTAK